jgi:hypothetical protein
MDGVQNGNETDTDCGGGAPCNGCGNGDSCNGPSDCASGFCIDGVCCDMACTGLCESCVMSQTGVADGSCADVAAGTDPENECSGVQVCDSGVCVGQANGASCGGPTDCMSGFCTDGVCCDMLCDGLCVACDTSRTGMADGTCTFVAAATDPDNECSGPQTCTAGVCGN